MIDLIHLEFVLQSNGILVLRLTKLGEITGRLLAIDLVGMQTLHLVTIYALNNSKDRKQFFQQMEEFLNMQTLLVGDFNSVTKSTD